MYGLKIIINTLTTVESWLTSLNNYFENKIKHTKTDNLQTDEIPNEVEIPSSSISPPPIELSESEDDSEPIYYESQIKKGDDEREFERVFNDLQY